MTVQMRKKIRSKNRKKAKLLIIKKNSTTKVISNYWAELKVSRILKTLLRLTVTNS